MFAFISYPSVYSDFVLENLTVYFNVTCLSWCQIVQPLIVYWLWYNGSAKLSVTKKTTIPAHAGQCFKHCI